jgi:predicted TIM-barrel fold metal-dependent hydrolase
MKIDVFNHIIPEKYHQAILKIASQNPVAQMQFHRAPQALFDIDLRFETMDKFKDYVQVLTLSLPPIEQITDAEKAVDLAKIANDELAELVAKYPDRFVSVYVVSESGAIEPLKKRTL